MFISTKPKAAIPSQDIIQIPIGDIFKNEKRGWLTQNEREESSQPNQRFYMRSSRYARILAYYDSDMITNGGRKPVPTLSAPTNMTSYDTDEWTVKASSEKYSDTVAWMAFNPDDGWRSSEWGSSSQMPCWIQWYNKFRVVRIREYRIKGSRNYGGPLQWELQGSNTADDWTVLDSVSQTSWPNQVTRTFQIPNNRQQFRYHRLYFTRATDGDNPIACIWAWSVPQPPEEGV